MDNEGFPVSAGTASVLGGEDRNIEIMADRALP
jgi:hypothetical protein